MRVQSLGQEDPLEKGMQPTPVFLPMKPLAAPVNKFAKSWTQVKQLNTHADRQEVVRTAIWLVRWRSRPQEAGGAPEPGSMVGLKRKQGMPHK